MCYSNKLGLWLFLSLAKRLLLYSDWYTVSFKDLGVNSLPVKALNASGIKKPYTIKKATLPNAINGKDILGRDQTSIGKTFACSLALMIRLDGSGSTSMKSLALLLSPTWELAMQISDVIAPLSLSFNLNSQVVTGGFAYSNKSYH